MSAVGQGTVSVRDETALDAERQTSFVDEAPFDRSTPYAEEKARIMRIVGNQPSGISYYGIIAELEGISTEEAGELASDAPVYNRVRRFVKGNPDFFDVERSSGVSVVYPTPSTLSLILGGITQNGRESGFTSGKDFAEKLLRTVGVEWWSDDDGRPHANWDWGEDEKHHIRRVFEEYLSRINDLNIILEAERPDVAPEYLSMDYKTRFNDRGRVNKQWSIQNSMLEKSGEWYDKAVFVTLTCWPGHYDDGSLWECIAGDRRRNGDSHDGINKHWNRFMSWISTDSRLGYRPDYLKVLEFQDNGSPHIHALIFLEDDNTETEPHLVPKNELDDYWSKWTGGYVNDMQPLVYDDDLGEKYDPDEGWIRWDESGEHGGMLEKSRESSDDEGYQTAGQYLGKYLSATYGGIKELGTSESFDESAESDKSDPWKLALYWATRRKIKTGSMDLRQAVEEDHDDPESEMLDFIRDCEYRVVGAYSYDNLPGYIASRMKTPAQLEAFGDVDDWRNPPVHSDGPIRDPPPDTLADDLDGSGLLHAEPEMVEETEPDEQDDDGDRGDEDGWRPGEQVLTDEEREEADELGGFDAADFM